MKVERALNGGWVVVDKGRVVAPKPSPMSPRSFPTYAAALKALDEAVGGAKRDKPVKSSVVLPGLVTYRSSS